MGKIASELMVERLIDWNLDLTQAPTAEERTRIYQEQADELKETLAKSDLPAEDRKLIREGLERGGVLSRLRTVVPAGATSTRGNL